MTTYLEEHLTHLRAIGRAKTTITARAHWLRRIDNELSRGLVRALTREIETWIASHDWESRWTLYACHSHLRGFFTWATAGPDPVLARDPMAQLPRPRPPRCVPNPVSDAELDAALAGSGAPWWTAIVLAAFAGLRASEIAGQAREDVSADWLTVRAGKGGDDATVPTHPVLWAMVRDCPPGPLVVRPDGRPVTGPWLSARQRKHFDRLGMPRVYLHRFRHWYGTTSQRLSGDLRITQENMRHASPQTTAGYAKVTSVQRRDAVTALPVPPALRFLL